MDASPLKSDGHSAVPSVAGVKRARSTLLPAFEPLSSPALPRPFKRRATTGLTERDRPYQKYPTPIPSSSTGILSSSPPRAAVQPVLQRSQSNLSERAPLTAVPTVVLAANGDELLMGRSSNTSHYQLSANRLISRVHVKARFVAALPAADDELPRPNKVEIVCTGWNGVKLHCQGRTWELAKGDSFTSETEPAEIMVDVQDARVRIQWPPREPAADADLSDSSWDSDESPTRRAAVNAGLRIASSPLPRDHLLRSPVSPSPAGPHTSMSTYLGSASQPVIHVYEDEPDDIRAAETASQANVDESSSSELSDLEDGYPDEENDPIVLSFGPYGANLAARMASMNKSDAPLHASPHSSPAKTTASNSTDEGEPLPLVNHVINQLAYSRLSSTPLTSILKNLPTSMKDTSPGNVENRGLTKDGLRRLLENTRCIGIIQRQGKDAAGQSLESEYYYIPDFDHDDERRSAVVDGLRKPSLRACRKQHKQYYWKRPRTP